MTVTGGFGTTTWTVTRGVNGSTAAAHVNSQTVVWNTPTSGLLAWNATTKTLSLSGTMFIDGSAKISDNALNSYDGQGTLYLSGTFRVTGSMCASVTASSCNFAGWNPNFDMFMVVANGSGGQGKPRGSLPLHHRGSGEGGPHRTKAPQVRGEEQPRRPHVGQQSN